MFLLKPAYAQCPVCIVTVGGGMLLAKKLGIDDLLVSIWISALNTAIAYWLAPKFKIKLLKNPLIFSFILYGFTLAYFQMTDQLNISANQILGINKILLGQTLGLVAMLAGNFLYAYTKRNNGDKTIFPYAKVVFPVVLVLLVTLIIKFSFNL